MTREAEQLAQRFDAILDRVQAAGAAADCWCRWAAIAARIEAVEQALQQQQNGTAGPVAAAPPPPAVAAAAATATRAAALQAATGADASPIQQRLAQELADKGFTDFRFVRVPADYYDRPLEFRADVLQAPSVDALCKSIIMENTRAHPSVNGWSDPLNSKYYTVIVQYTARLNADKLKNHIHKLNGGRIAKQYFNMRLCPEDVSDGLSGYEHNAVTPIGMKTPLPIILSHEITRLDPDLFFLGAGEVDLKVGTRVSEFVQAYQPMVVDCTY